MKVYKQFFIFLLSSFLFGIYACSEDNEVLTDPAESKGLTLDLKSKDQPVVVKVGATPHVLNIEGGKGDYRVLSLNEAVAQATIEGNKLLIKGIANGKTSLVVTDHDGYYSKVNLVVYTTDQLVLETNSLDLTSSLGREVYAAVRIELGNGGYTITSDNEAIEASVSNNGVIEVWAVSQPEVQQAVLTLNDVYGLSATIDVRVSASQEIFSVGELEAIKQNAERRYVVNGIKMEMNGSVYFNTLSSEGVQRYGWTFMGHFHVSIAYQGHKQVGDKQQATFACNAFDGTLSNHFEFEELPVNLEIIKNDGAKLWGVFYFIEDGVLHSGHFCDLIDS